MDGWVSHRTVSFQTDHTAEQRKCNSPSATSGYVPTAISVTSDRLFNMSMNTERHAFNLGFDCEDGKQQR